MADKITDLMPRDTANLVSNPIIRRAREVADEHGLKLHFEATGRSTGKITFTVSLIVPGKENAPPPTSSTPRAVSDST